MDVPFMWGFRANEIPASFAQAFESKLLPEFGCMP